MRSELDRLAHWGGLVAELATAVVVTDVAGRIVIWNPAAARLYGWKADDVLGRRVTPLLLSPDLEGEVATALTSIAAGRRWAGELECKRRDGTRAPVHVTLSAAYDDDGRVIGFVGESRDLSDLKAAEGHASATEQRFHSLLMHTTEVACVTDEHAVFKYVVPSSQSALGYATHELVGTSGLDLVHPDDVELVRGAFADVVADASLHPVVVYRARARDGAEHWREMRLTNALHDPTIVGIVCNVTDMTEQQQLIGELRSADARQRAIVARSRDATLFFERDGTIRWASPVSTDLLGVAPDELIGRNGFEFIHPKDQERALAQFVSMSALGDHVRIEFRIVNAHGDVRWLEEDATNLVDDPDVGYVVGNLRDITDRKRAEEQLERHALYDMLTGLPNRSLLVNRLEQLLE
ncbi:MAG TPA: PAS domain S-box protein, partial [Acidimicrobiia bacterium]